MLEGVGARGAAQHAHLPGGLQAVADDVADDQRDAAAGELERVVPVAADAVAVGGREIARRELAARQLGREHGQQAALERLDRRALALVALGAGQRDAGGERELARDRRILLAERGAGGGPQVQRPRASRAGAPRRLDAAEAGAEQAPRLGLGGREDLGGRVA